LVIAANTGFSAAIDGCGRLIARGPRRDTASLRVAMRPDGRPTLWLAAGSLPAGLTLAVVAILALAPLVGRRLASRGRGGRKYVFQGEGPASGPPRPATRQTP
jgi:apolipoprotein N-acyltransferase